MLVANAYYHFDHIEVYYRDIPDLLDLSKRRFFNLIYHWMREHISEDDWNSERRDNKGNFAGLSYSDIFSLSKDRYNKLMSMKTAASDTSKTDVKRMDGTFNFLGFGGITKEGDQG